MMKINRPKNKRTKIIVTTLVAVLVLGGAYFAYARANDTWPFQPAPTASQDPAKAGGSSYADYSSPTDEQADAGLKAKEDSVQDEQSDTDGPSSAESKKEVAVVITSVHQNTKKQIDVRTSIATLDDEGTCTLTLTKAGSKAVTQTAKTQIITSYSACSGFLVPGSQLASGKWTVKINYEGAKAKGSATSTVDVE